MQATFTIVLPFEKQEGFRYFDEMMARWNVSYVNPSTDLVQFIRASSESNDLEMVPPSQIDDIIQEGDLKFLHYWNRSKIRRDNDLILTCQERGLFWEFAVTDPATGKHPDWHGSATYVLIVQELVRDAITRFGGNYDDQPMITMMFD